MRIQPLQNKQQYQSSTNFKAAYPVVHWVAETNGSYAPVMSANLTRKLQRALVMLINKSVKEKASAKSKFVGEYLSKCDMDYRRNRNARSYYNIKGGWKDGRFDAISYLITGNDAQIFSSKYGKNIGKSKSEAAYVDGVRVSADLNEANRNYLVNGLRFVKDKNKRIYDADGIEYALHTKFQTKRNKSGEVIGYDFVDLKFCPQEGSQNPFVRVGLSKLGV